jgi:hypothetical protein
MLHLCRQSITLLRIWEVPASILGPGDRLSWPRFLVAFLSPSRRMPEYYFKIRPLPLPTASFPIHYHSLPIIDAVWSSYLKSVVK